MIKKNGCKVLFELGTALFLVLCFIQPAYAYLDPGTGSIIIQGLIGGLIAVGVVARLYWDRLLKMLGFRKDIDSEDTD